MAENQALPSVDAIQTGLARLGFRDLRALKAGRHGNMVLFGRHEQYGNIIAKITRNSRSGWLDRTRQWSKMLSAADVRCPRIVHGLEQLELETGEHLPLLVEEFIPGCPPITSNDYRALGQLVGRLHALPVPAIDSNGVGNIDDLFQTWNVLRQSANNPTLECRIERSLEYLAEQDRVVSHADLHVANLVITSSGPVVIDLEMMQAAPREFDIGRVLTFRTDLMMPAIARPFLDGYQAAAGLANIDLEAGIVSAIMRKIWLHTNHPDENGDQVNLDGLLTRLESELAQVDRFHASNTIEISRRPRASALAIG